MWLGIDVGTGGTRALLVDEGGKIRAGHTAPHEEMRMERPLWAEQRPQDWWDAAVKAIHGVLAGAKISGREVRGVGLSGQMHGLVILDKDDHVIRPSLIWCDQRSQAQVDHINRTVGSAKVLNYTANPVLTGFTLPKLLWVRDNEPENYARVRKMLLPKDYVRFKLTGEYATEVSDASGTALFDVVHREWSSQMIEALALDASILPKCHESAEETGAISSSIAGLTGLAPGTPVVGGGGDQAASAVGNGIVELGVVSCTLGTSGVVFAHMDQVTYDPLGRVHTFCHAVPGKWHVMGVTQGAGLSLQWFRNQLSPGSDYEALMSEAEKSPVGAQGLFWLPYLMGERTPYLDPIARGGWIGLTAKHTRADLIRALIEGVSYSQKDCLDIIQQLGVAIYSVRVSGGGGKSAFWRQVLASILEKPVVSLATQEGSAYGAALLALVGTGAYASVPEVCRSVIRETGSVTPRAWESEFYQNGHGVYRAIYPALKPVTQMISHL
ncbi:MAG: xylulokinase [Acidobacteria bacterium]|nr:MAG: xylulokinase [Acidobacteriota bacterium]